MKKLYKVLITILFSFTLISCSSVVESFVGEKLFGLTKEEEFSNKMKSYKLQANIKTTKGDIKVYLYPEAAPKLVANFVFLAKSGYYNDLNFHRVSVNNIIQSGDRSVNHDGTGNPGYTISDEFSYLKFDRSGILAMANTGKDTNGSQFFVTLQRVDAYNDNYSIIGNLIDSNDLTVARLIRQDDKILDVEITGYNVNTFLNNFSKEIEEWTKGLEKTGYIKLENNK
jgi:peptidyl-prolyl cis-trans isomerase cyclophilin type